MENNDDFPDDLRDIDITDIGQPEDVDMAELLDNLVEGIVLNFTVASLSITDVRPMFKKRNHAAAMIFRIT